MIFLALVLKNKYLLQNFLNLCFVTIYFTSIKVKNLNKNLSTSTSNSSFVSLCHNSVSTQMSQKRRFQEWRQRIEKQNIDQSRIVLTTFFCVDQGVAAIRYSDIIRFGCRDEFRYPFMFVKWLRQTGLVSSQCPIGCSEKVKFYF